MKMHSSDAELLELSETISDYVMWATVFCVLVVSVQTCYIRDVRTKIFWKGKLYCEELSQKHSPLSFKLQSYPPRPDDYFIEVSVSTNNNNSNNSNYDDYHAVGDNGTGTAPSSNDGMDAYVPPAVV